jgi:Fanconi anemia group M protein
MGIHSSHMTELTGQVTHTKREQLWKQARVIFATPQTVLKDMESNICPAHNIACLVLDEAHHATKNYAYVLIVQKLKNTRILGLSATPGTQIEKVQEVINNLRIASLIVKNINDPDVKPYVHDTSKEVVIVEPSQNIAKLKQMAYKLVKGPLDRLIALKKLPDQIPESFTSFYLLQVMKEVGRSRDGLSFAAQGDLGCMISLITAINRLESHGIVSFKDFLKKNFIDLDHKTSRAKENIRNAPDFVIMMRLVDEYLESESSGQHPKLVKLVDLLCDHFKSCRPDSRVLVFAEFRSSVEEITAMLNKHNPLIRAMKFVGQSGQGTKQGKTSTGLSQKEQLRIVESFKKGHYNTLVATSIAEEGLDIGEIDLCVFFDYTASPIRSTQRMGRTGRKKIGKCVILVTKGKEERSYYKNHQRNDSIMKLLKARSEGKAIKGKQLEFCDASSQSIFPPNEFPSISFEECSPVEFVHQFGVSKAVKRRPRESAALDDNQRQFLYQNFKLSPSELESCNFKSKFGSEAANSVRIFKVNHSRDTLLFKSMIRLIESYQFSSSSRPADIPVADVPLEVVPAAISIDEYFPDVDEYDLLCAFESESSVPRQQRQQEEEEKEEVEERVLKKARVVVQKSMYDYIKPVAVELDVSVYPLMVQSAYYAARLTSRLDASTLRSS